MEIIEINNEEYKKLVKEPFCRFNKAEFYLLNEHKVDKVYYLLFNDGKNRFSLVVGVKDCLAKAPFSASFEVFSEITRNNKIAHYHEAIQSLLEWSKNKNIEKIKISLPPCYYNISHIAKMENALFSNGFYVENYDVNFNL